MRIAMLGRVRQRLSEMATEKFGVEDVEAAILAGHPDKKQVRKVQGSEYRIDVYLDDKDDVVVRVFTSVSTKSGVARSSGKDMIRFVLWSRRAKKPVGPKFQRIQRVKGWEVRVQQRIKEIAKFHAKRPGLKSKPAKAPVTGDALATEIDGVLALQTKGKEASWLEIFRKAVEKHGGLSKKQAAIYKEIRDRVRKRSGMSEEREDAEKEAGYKQARGAKECAVCQSFEREDGEREGYCILFDFIGSPDMTCGSWQRRTKR